MIIETSQIVPAAQGIKIKLDHIINYFIEIVKLYFYIVFRLNPTCAEIGRAARLS